MKKTIAKIIVGVFAFFVVVLFGYLEVICWTSGWKAALLLHLVFAFIAALIWAVDVLNKEETWVEVDRED